MKTQQLYVFAVNPHIHKYVSSCPFVATEIRAKIIDGKYMKTSEASENISRVPTYAFVVTSYASSQDNNKTTVSNEMKGV